MVAMDSSVIKNMKWRTEGVMGQVYIQQEPRRMNGKE